jgi:hypothetical protein
MNSTEGADLPLESPEATRDDDINPRRTAYFPRRYLTDFFKFLKEHHADIEVLSYADLPWGEDSDYEHNYPIEYRNWLDQLASGKRDANKAYVVLQYDVDTRPERTMALLLESDHVAIPSNIMIFNRRIDRRRLMNTGELAFTDYALNIELLKRLEGQGFVVGYHSNAYEQSLFDVQRALDIFDADIKALARDFNIRHFSAHGGVPDAYGKNNCHLPLHTDWRTKLKWVNNGSTVRFDDRFTDGGHNSMTRDPSGRDLRAFVARFAPGKRYGILLHPQYYEQEPRPSPRYTGTEWYDTLLDAAQRPESLWRDVRLGQPASSAMSGNAGRIRGILRNQLRRWL